jgi:predicted ATPase
MMGHVPPIADIRGPLVGRAAELDRLAGLVGLPSSGSPGTGPEGAVLLAGDAGVGKTRLLAELRARAEDAGYRVLVGHCLDFGDSALPYLPFSEAFGRLATEAPTLARSLVEAGPAIARLMPARRVLPEQSAPADDESHVQLDRPDLFAAVHAALELLGRAEPLLLIVEDVHWADRSTREMLSFLFSRRFDAPVAVVASYRSDDLHRRHPLRTAAAEWSRLPGVSRVELGRLLDDDVRALVGSLHRGPMSERSLRGIVERAEGNAFFTEELVGATEVGPDSIPEALADLLLVRLDQLDEDARHVVRAASVSGRRVPHLLLDRVLDGQVGALDVALRAAVERNVLVPMGGDGYAFRHALLAEAVYDDLLPGERVRLHAAYAKALQQGGVGGTAAELARHARAANDLATAARASVAAGDEAMAVAGPDEAARHYELALELATDTDIEGIDVVELTAKACEAALAAGQTYRALALARDQLRATSPDTHPHARLRLLRVKASVAIVADAGADPLMNTSEALELLEKHPDDTLRAQILALHARALWETRRHDEAAAVAT